MVSACQNKNKRKYVPLVQEIAVRVYDIRLAKFMLDESHDMRQI